MKKVILSVFTCLNIFAVISAQGQDVNAGVKFLNYERLTSAEQVFQKLIAANPKDVQATYWLGQTYIADDKLNDAKTLYQNALTAGMNEPLIWIGAGQVDILTGGDVNAAKQKFEQALTTATSTKGKNKGQPDPNVLNAVGRAMASGGTDKGDAQYGIDKLKQAAQLDPKNPDVYVNLGLCYLKLGGNHGGEAFEAFRQAATIDPQYARAYYRMGRLYMSQRNKESMDENFGKAISADATFAPVYAAYFNYYSERDVTAAKEYLDKFVANADKDCKTDYFVGDYLLRAGKYQESLQQAKTMESGACKNFPPLNLLYAYDYDRMGDSVQARMYIQKYFSTASADVIQPRDYAFAGTVLAKFPETGDSAITYLKKAIELDTVKSEQTEFLNKAATVAASSGNYHAQLELLRFAEKINGGKLSETQYFNLSKAAVDAAAKDTLSAYDSVKYLTADSIILAYIIAYPDKPQGYSFRTRFAKITDRDTSRGLAINPMQQQKEFLTKDTGSTNKKTIFTNDYYLLIYYAQYATDLPKEQEYQRAIDVTEEMKKLFPEPNSEEYRFADNTGKQLKGSLEKYQKSKNSNSGGGTGKP